MELNQSKLYKKGLMDFNLEKKGVASSSILFQARPFTEAAQDLNINGKRRKTWCGEGHA
jgi:hypothetical protein